MPTLMPMFGHSCALAISMSRSLTRLRYHSSMISGRLQQRELLELRDVRRRASAARGSGVSTSMHRRIGRQRHQRAQFGLRELQVLPADGQQRHRVEQRALVGQDLLARHQALVLRLARLAQRVVGAREQAVDLRQQALRAERAPVGVAHVLQHVLRDLAAALLGHQDLVGPLRVR